MSFSGTSLPSPQAQRLSRQELRRLSPAALAHLGDAVYELHIRQHLLFPPRRISQYHRQVVSRVCGQAQAQVLEALSTHLTPEEQEIVRWGSNGCRNPPRHLSPEIYRQASGLETLIGVLHLTDPYRLQQLLSLADGAVGISLCDKD